MVGGVEECVGGKEVCVGGMKVCGRGRGVLWEGCPYVLYITYIIL